MKCNIIGTWRETHYRKWLVTNLHKNRTHYVVEFGLSESDKDELIQLESHWMDTYNNEHIVEQPLKLVN